MVHMVHMVHMLRMVHMVHRDLPASVQGVPSNFNPSGLALSSLSEEMHIVSISRLFHVCQSLQVSYLDILLFTLERIAAPVAMERDCHWAC
jgi:hypothetical protein